MKKDCGFCLECTLSHYSSDCPLCGMGILLLCHEAALWKVLGGKGQDRSNLDVDLPPSWHCSPDNTWTTTS